MAPVRSTGPSSIGTLKRFISDKNRSMVMSIIMQRSIEPCVGYTHWRRNSWEYVQLIRRSISCFSNGFLILIFIGVVFYFKVPQKVSQSLDESIKKIKEEIDNAEKLKDEAKNILGEYESKVGKSKEEIKNLIHKAEKQAEANIIKTNEEFHNIVENRKKAAEEKIKQMKTQAIKDVKNSSVDIAIRSIEKIIKNSIDKKKLDKIYISSIDEAKKILKNKSI